MSTHILINLIKETMNNEKLENVATVLKVIAAIIAAVLGAFGADAMVR